MRRVKFPHVGLSPARDEAGRVMVPCNSESTGALRVVDDVAALTVYADIRIYVFMKMNMSRMLAAADDASGLLKAMANRHRLIIICQLIERERSVGELAALLQIRDSTVSQHLALLRKDGLVTARRDGQTIWYSIGSRAARELARALYRVYCPPPATSGRRTRRATRRRLAPSRLAPGRLAPSQ